MKIDKIDKSIIGKVSQLNDISDDYIIFCNDIELLQKKLDNMKIVHFSFPFIEACYVQTAFDNISILTDFECVRYVVPNTQVCTMIYKALEFCNVKSLSQNQFYGENISIAYKDTGIHPHFDFLLPKRRIVAFKDLLHEKNVLYDDNGHGTFVAGIGSGNGTIDRRIIGVAPQTNIVSIKALDKNGETSANTILDAMQYIYDNKAKYNIRVVCMSFGAECSEKIDPLQKGAETLWNSGLVVVAAAGNSGPTPKTIKSPGANSRIITVGGIDDGRSDGVIKIANFSSRGPSNSKYKPDLVAPSVNMTSCNNFKNKKFYDTMSGTSVATPFVAGLSAIILQKYKNFYPDQVKHFLTTNCIPIEKNRNSEGFGYIKF